MIEVRRQNNGREVQATQITVALVGDAERRARLRGLLRGRADVVAEIAEARRAFLLAEVAPDVVLLDCGADGVNPFVALPLLAALPGAPRIVAVADGAAATAAAQRALSALGADAVADLGDARSVLAAIAAVAPGEGSHERRLPFRATPSLAA